MVYGCASTVGGAVYGNAGAFGGEMKYIAEEVEFLISSKFKVQSSKLVIASLITARVFLKSIRNGLFGAP